MNDDLKERYKKANEEFQELLKWDRYESDKITEKLKAEGKYIAGLDTNREAYAPVNAEFKRRVNALFEKYDLPNKPQL